MFVSGEGEGGERRKIGGRDLSDRRNEERVVTQSLESIW